MVTFRNSPVREVQMQLGMNTSICSWDCRNVTECSTSTDKSCSLDQVKSMELTVVIPVCISLTLLIIPGNILVIVYLRKNKEFSRNFTIYAMALAVADLGVGIIGVPLYVVQLLRPEWLINVTMCISSNVIGVSPASVSMFLLDAIAYDRYKCVVSPILYRTCYTQRRSILISISVWLLGFVAWILYFVGQQFSDVYSTRALGLCDIGFGYLTLGQAALAYYLPIIFLVVMYIVLLRALKKRGIIGESSKKRRTDYVVQNGVNQEFNTGTDNCEVAVTNTDISDGRMSRREPIFTGSQPEIMFMENRRGRCSVNKNSTPNTDARQGHVSMDIPRGKAVGTVPQSTNFGETSVKKTSNQNQKCFKTMSIVVATFLLCWAPFCLIWPITQVCQDCIPDYLFDFSVFLSFANSVCNPFIYVLTSKTICAEMKKMLRRR